MKLSLSPDIGRVLLATWLSVKIGGAFLMGRLIHRPLTTEELARRIRIALERLGGTYIKLGQFVAMRFDLVPRDVARELEKLFDTAPALPLADVLRVVEEELGRPSEELFDSFEAQPIAAASIAQVHAATTRDGERAAVKVQRPAIATIMGADMRNMRRIARVLDAFSVLGSLSLIDAVDEFAYFTLREMDFVVEGQTADRLRGQATPNEKVPTVRWDLTRRRVLTMEFVDGLTFQELARRFADGRIEHDPSWSNLDIDTVLHNLATASLHQLFATGFFHADPHPGNIIALRDNNVAFVDFGIFGELVPYERDTLTAYIRALSAGNIDQSFRYISRLMAPTPCTDRQAFASETKAVLRRWYQAVTDLNTPPEQRYVGKYFGELVDVVRRHRVRASANTLLFWRALIALDSTALRLSAQFDLLTDLINFFRTLPPPGGATQLEPRSYEALVDLSRTAPRHVRDILGAPGSRARATRWRRNAGKRGEQLPGRRTKHLVGALLLIALSVLVVAQVHVPLN